MKKFKWIGRLLFFLNVLTGICLLISVFSLYADPAEWWWPPFMGLAFLHLFLINVLFFVFWFTVKKKYTLFSLVFIIFGLTELPNHFQLNMTDSPWNRSVKILSLNVRNFDLYNWSSNKKTRNKIFQVINKSRAEVICLQEFFNTTDPRHNFKTLDTIITFKGNYHAHVEYTATVKFTENWGIATFTTFPIINTGKIRFEESTHNLCIYTDVLIGEDTLRIYNMHLASIRFAEEDYVYLDNIGSQEIDNEMNEGLNLVRKLRSAYEKRAVQARAVREHIDTSPYPVIVCGDFNDTPTSYTYHTISKDLNDTFKSKGNGFGATYNGRLPFLRIDYIFTDPALRILKHEVLRTNISDHFPICASIELKR